MRHQIDSTYARLVKNLCGRRFWHFCKYFWPVVNPAYEFVDERSIEVMCDHAQAISERRLALNNLVVNIPPRSLKSTIWDVLWPAWEWGPGERPSTRFLYSSYKADLAIRDSVACRRLVESPEFQALWNVSLAGDQNVKSRFDVVGGGYRYCIAVGSTTGEGGDITVCDDPHDAMHAFSIVERTSVKEWHDQSWFNRVNDPRTGRRVVVCQRIHADDLSAHLIKKGGWEHLNLPEEYDPDSEAETSLPFVDWRTTPGDLLRPERFAEKQVEEAKRELGIRGYLAQHQQKPMGDEGAFFQRKWFDGKTMRVKPAGARYLRYWDVAVTEVKDGNDPDWAVGALVGRDHKGRLIVADIRRLRGTQGDLDAAIQETARQDGRQVRIYIETVALSKGLTHHIQTKVLPGWPVYPHIVSRVTGAKMARAAPVQSAAEAGNVLLVEGIWNKTMLDEFETFPGGAHDDQVDAVAGGWLVLTKNPPAVHKGQGGATGQVQAVPLPPRIAQSAPPSGGIVLKQRAGIHPGQIPDAVAHPDQSRLMRAEQSRRPPVVRVPHLVKQGRRWRNGFMP